jgi:hypothetical protein
MENCSERSLEQSSYFQLNGSYGCCRVLQVLRCSWATFTQDYGRNAAPWGLLCLIPSFIVFEAEFRESMTHGTGMALRIRSQGSSSGEQWWRSCCDKAICARNGMGFNRWVNSIHSSWTLERR